MADHEIHKLNVQIDGPLQTNLKEILETKVLSILERYFDLYDQEDLEILFNRIELDLGNIDLRQFEAEFEVRLSYLLDQELSKIQFEEEGAYQLSGLQASDLRILRIYLKEGFNAEGDESLSDLFERLLKSKFEALKSLVLELKGDQRFRERLKQQLEPKVLDEFWKTYSPEGWKAVRAVEKALYADLKVRAKKDRSDLESILEEHRFQFLLEHERSDQSALQYINLLIEHIDDFSSFGHLTDDGVYRYFGRLAETFQPKTKQEKTKSRQESLRELLEFVRDGRVSSLTPFEELTRFGKTALPSELDKLISAIDWDLNEAGLSKQLERAQRAMSTEGLYPLLRRMSRMSRASLRERSKTLLSFFKFARTEYSIDLFQFKVFSLRLVTTAAKGKASHELTEELIEQISAASAHSPSEIQSALKQYVEESKLDIPQREVQTLKDVLSEEFELSTEDLKEQRKLQDETDHLRALVFFLSSGVWLMPSVSSQSVLDELIEQNIGALARKLHQEWGNDRLWGRLIFQFETKSVYHLLQEIFGEIEDKGKGLRYVGKHGLEFEAETFPKIIELWQIFDQAWQGIDAHDDVQRSLLFRSFRQVLSSSELSQLDVSQAFQEELDWLRGLEEHRAVLEAQERKEESRIEGLLRALPEDKIQVPDSGSLNQLIALLQSKASKFQALLIDDRISTSQWERFLAAASRDQLVSMFQATYKLRGRDLWINQWLNFISSSDAEFIGTDQLRQSFAAFIKEDDLNLRRRFVQSTQETIPEKGEVTSWLSQQWQDFVSESLDRPDTTDLQEHVLLDISRSLESGELHFSESAKSKKAFQEILLDMVRGGELTALFVRSRQEDVLRFLRAFPKTFHQKLFTLLSSKFRQDAFEASIVSLIAQHPQDSENLRLEAVAFVLGQERYSERTFMRSSQFDLEASRPTEESFEEWELAQLFSLLSEDQLTQEVQDEASAMLLKALQFDSKGFWLQVQERSSRELLRSILKVLSPPLWPKAISQVFSKTSSEVLDFVRQKAKRSSIDETELLTDLIRAQLSTRKPLASAYWESLLKRGVSASDLGELRKLKLIDKPSLAAGDLQKIPEEVLSLGIEPPRAEHHLFELIESLFRSGQLPSWSSIRRLEDAQVYVLELSKKTPGFVRSLFESNLEDLSGVQLNETILGRSLHERLLRRWHPELIRSQKKLLADFQSLLSYLASKEQISSKLKTQILYLLRKYGGEQERVRLELFSSLPGLLNLSRAEILRAVATKKTKLAKEIQSQIRMEEVQTEEDSSFEHNLLLHLLLEDEIPWWAEDSSLVKRKSKARIRRELSEKALSEEAKTFVQAAFKSGRLPQVLQQLSSELDLAVFERLLLALSPTVGGFAVSLNLLIHAHLKDNLPSDWISKSIQFFAQNPNYGPNAYLRQATLHFARELRLGPEEIQEEWQHLSSAKLAEAEMRFMPVKQLLITQQGVEFEGEDRQEDARFLGLELSDRISGFFSYLKTGSSAFRSAFPFRSLEAFIQDLKALNPQAKEEIRLRLIQELQSESTLTAALRDRPPAFQSLLLDLIYGRNAMVVSAWNRSIQAAIQQIRSTIDTKAWRLKLLRFLLEVSKSEQALRMSAEQLTLAFLRRFSEEEKISTREWSVMLEQSSALSQMKRILAVLAEGKTEELGEVELIDEAEAPQVEMETPTESTEEEETELLEHRLLIHNAGLVICWPFLTRYFEMLEMVDDGAFKSEEHAVRAVHLIQYIATGSTKAPEHELILNKVLCGLTLAVPVPLEVELTEEEIKTTEMMFSGMLQNWERLKDSSMDAVREGFMVRDGFIEETEKTWELKVEKKTLDILVENLPWSLGMIKLPWMEKRLNVEWL
jgi:hypothetical protein